MQFSFKALPVNPQVPRVLAIYPPPSVPLAFGLDAVVSARFSAEPKTREGVRFGGQQVTGQQWVNSGQSTPSFWEEDGRLAIFFTKSSTAGPSATLDLSGLRD